MNLRVISGLSILVLLLGVVSSSNHSAFALEKPTKEQYVLKKDLKLIMYDYMTAIAKAKAELLSSVKKANADAKLAVQKGIPMDEINAVSKATIAKARADLKLDIQKAKVEAKAALLQLKAAVDKSKLS